MTSDQTSASRPRVALVNLPTITAPVSFSYFGAVPPLGLAYVAAAVRAAGHPLQVIDATGAALHRRVERDSSVGRLVVAGLDEEEIASAIAPGTDVIGISLMFLHQWPWFRDCLLVLRRRHPGARIVAGGETATAYWRHMLAEAPELDVCVCGEGEETFTELLSHGVDGAAGEGVFARVPGLAYRDGAGRPRQSPPRVRIRDLDELSEPAWDLFPVEAYLERPPTAGVDRGRSLPLLTSRGCPYRCSFCSAPSVWTTRYRRRSPERVADEIQGYVRRYGITNVDLNDLASMLTPRWIEQFARVTQERRLQVTFQLPSGTRSEAVNPRTARWLRLAGCRNFCFAPESGSARTLDRIHKQVDIGRLREAVQAVREADIATHACFIIGFPHEGLSELWESYRLLLRLAADGLDTVAVMVFAPYPGSEEYERLEQAGRIVHDERYHYSSLLRSTGAKRSAHPRWSARELLVAQLGFLLSFYGVAYARRPKRVLGTLSRLLSGRQRTVMDQFLATKLGGWRRRRATTSA